jgi:undecaprenyl-diphosphatase
MMMDIFQAIFLGTIQGITEWLPISSSGHLVILQEFLGISATVSFDLLLHLGTLAVLVFFFRMDILGIFRALLKGDFASEEGRTGIFLVIASVPIFLAGFLFEPLIDAFFANAYVAAIGFIITGILLYLTKGRKNNLPVGKKSAINIGISQAIALVPGISRSGATISTGILSGVQKDVAARFSFLLAIPAVLGAFVLKIGEFSFDPSYIAGFVSSVVVGYMTLTMLLRIIRTGDFYKFSYYCFLLGFSLIAVLSLV